MRNEWILVLSLVLCYGGVLVFYRLLDKLGLYVWTALATIAANIEALILVDAFGMEQTLGNILFASTFLVTDILSENAGKESASRAVKTGILVSIAFVVLSQLWLCYTPSENDWAMPAIQAIFRNTPRLMLVSVAVYGIVQVFDVFAYHAIWKHTTRLFGNSRRGLWIRNNGSTLLSQLLNTVLFNFGAFYGIHPFPTLIHICLSSYVIFLFTSLLDTPVVYLARRMAEQRKTPQ